MKIIFRKKDLPLLSRFAAGRNTPREGWTLARRMRLGDGFQDHAASAFLLLSRSAERGDVWAMCELARLLFDEGGEAMLPVALSWWHRAAKVRDPGTLRDLENLDILKRIKGYRGGKGAYGDIEMRCALLTEWVLTRMGRDRWENLSFEEQRSRAQKLINEVAPVLHIRPPELYTRPHLLCNGKPAGGLAHAGTRQIGIPDGTFADYPYLLQVLFHELGHFVVFSMWDGKNKAQMERYGITPERVRSWHDGDMGLEVPTGEEDPDTLSYGVYTTWLILFGTE